jgi:hypothetical protein
MVSRLKSTEEVNSYRITSGVAIEILQFEDHIQDAIFHLLSYIHYPGDGVYDSYAMAVDDRLRLEIKFIGESDNSNIIYSIQHIDNIDVYLDYINLKKVVRWNIDTMTLTGL